MNINKEIYCVDCYVKDVKIVKEFFQDEVSAKEFAINIKDEGYNPSVFKINLASWRIIDIINI